MGVEPLGVRTVVASSLDEAESILISFHPVWEFCVTISACVGVVRWWETNLDQVERQSIEELVCKKYGVLFIIRHNSVQIVVPLNPPAKLLDERFQRLFLNRAQMMARLYKVYLLYRRLCCLKL